MSIRRHNAKRDANEGQIIAAFESLKCQVKRLDVPVDLLVLLPGGRGLLLVEVKTRTGTLTKDQAAFVRTWPVHVVRSVDDAISLVGAKQAA